MINYKTHIWLLSILTFFLLTACKKEPPEYYIEPDFKSWSCYKKGSYWVYLNEKTGAQDCTWVIKDTSYIRFYNSGYEYDKRYNEVFKTELSSNLYDGYYTMAGSTTDVTEINFFPSYFGRITYSYDLIQSPKFNYRTYRNTIENYGVAQVYAQEVVNGTAFSNVYDIRHEWISEHLYHYGDSLIISIHLVKNIGIVKMRKYQEGADTVWSIQRWKVYQ